MKRYNPKELEPAMQKFWEDNQTYKANLDTDKPKYLGMSMFNYPSGLGIHIGHALNYTISDVMARFKRQQGYESYHPVGWDSFGLPAENYAIKAGVSPQESMAEIIPNYHKQYKAMGWSNDWSKEIATHEPEYYKWTQWIFSEMYRAGLAYQDARMQWWCAKCQTVLANEQVLDGKCWRHDAADDPEVAKKEVKQWFFRITDYADELLEATDDLNWTETVKLAQKNWIGKSVGAEVDFALDGKKADNTVASKKPNFVILHGFTGRADKNFIPTLRKSLELEGYVVKAPQLPNSDNPTEAEQVGYVLENCDIDEDTIIIGHSLGCAVAMKVLEKMNHKIHGLILVAPVVEAAFRTGEPRNFWNNFNLTYNYKAVLAKAPKRIILSDRLEEDKRGEYIKYLANKIDASVHETTATKIHFTGFEEPFIVEQTKNFLGNAALVDSSNKITVFTTRPDTLFGATFLVLAPEHDMVAALTTKDQKQAVESYIKQAVKKTEVERQASKEKTGVFSGSYAVNPVNNDRIPIWIADYVLSGYGTGAIMAVPAHDERDNEFASKFDLPIKEVISVEGDDKTLEGVMINSGVYDGIRSDEAREKIVADLEAKGLAKSKTIFKIRDWSVSRQRYWGAPIPIINCPECGPALVPDKDLPVKLPVLEDFAPSGDGRSALARASDWLKVDCPKCGGQAERETDTLDTYICSSWYMLRYADPHNDKAAFDSQRVNKWLPVDFYNGADHATAHMIYARFITRFFHKKGLIDNPEPFKKFLFNGKVTASDGQMFSKSKGNGVDPLEIIGQGYGADALRTYLMFAAPLELWIRWDPQGVPGAYRFINRVWNLVQEFLEKRGASSGERSGEESLLKLVHPVIKKVTEDLEDQKYNTAIATLMKLTNDLYEQKAKAGFNDKNWQFALESLVMLMAPFAPHAAEGLWQELGHKDSVNKDNWPVWDDKFLVSDTVTVAVQINGKLRGTVELTHGASQEEALAAAKNQPKVVAHLADEPKKVIYVPGKILNLVV